MAQDPQPRVALSVAGSDAGGGAGVQADLKVFHAHGVYGAAAVSAVTAQNGRGVEGLWPLPPEALEAQVRSTLAQLPVAAAKTGMLYSPAHVQALARALAGRDLPLVVDPVLSASSGGSLSSEGLVPAVRELLFPLAALLTPNLDEAAALLGRPQGPGDRSLMEEACEGLVYLGARAVLLKGGHLPGGPAVDLLYDGHDFRCFETPRLSTANTHGTGCALSAAITAQLALGRTLSEAVGLAKAWLFKALEGSQDWRLGPGPGPLDHFVRPQPL